MKDNTKTIKYEGHVISQNGYNHHVMISKDNRMVFHSQCDKPMTEQELINLFHNYKKIAALTAEMFAE